MPKATRVTIVCENTTKWGDLFPVSTQGYDRTETPWLKAEAWQGGKLVYGQYIRGSSGSFTVGPTWAADESKVAKLTVEAGYFNRRGTFSSLGEKFVDIGTGS